MEALEEKLGYRFTNRAFLENALTHSSYANENKAKGLQSNERLEFLGDSVLGMVVADYLFRTHPDLPEGDLTRTRAALVCEGSLVEVAQCLELGAYLKLGKGEEAGGGRERPSIIADAVEAVLAALKLGWVKLEQVRTAALFLIGIFPLLFVPAAAGVMDLWAELHAMLLPVLIALVPVTFLVMATAGRVTQRFAKAEPELEEELANDDAQ